MDIVRMVRSTKVTALPVYAYQMAQRQIGMVKKDVQDWASVVDFVIHPVDVNLALENADIDPTQRRKRSAA